MKKSKLNWGHYMAIAMLSFMIFILYFVYNTFTKASHDHHLVSKEYYMDEMNFQQEIDALANAKKLNTNVKFEKIPSGIKIIFPVELNEIKGELKMQRPATSKTDITLPIKLNNNEMIIPKEQLIDGLYNVKIKWSANNTNYLYKDKYQY